MSDSDAASSFSSGAASSELAIDPGKRPRLDQPMAKWCGKTLDGYILII